MIIFLSNFFFLSSFVIYSSFYIISYLLEPFIKI